MIASDQPGTTRDSILVPFERDGHSFLLIDTAGVRRRARVEDVVERASVAKTLQAIDEAHVVILVLDAHDTVAEQDASVLGLALERGRALIIAVNKWDGIPQEQREEIHRQLALKLDFVPFAPLFFISARHGTGVGELMGATVRAYEAAMRAMPSVCWAFHNPVHPGVMRPSGDTAVASTITRPLPTIASASRSTRSHSTPPIRITHPNRAGRSLRPTSGRKASTDSRRPGRNTTGRWRTWRRR